METMKPHATNSSKMKVVDNLFLLQEIIDKYLACDPLKWSSLFEKSGLLRVVHLSAWVPGSHRSTYLLYRDRKTRVNMTENTKEVKPRTFLIQFKDNKKCWCDLFEIKESTLPNAGLGLFALRPIKAEEIIGFYMGKSEPSPPKKEPTEYAMEYVNKSNGLPMTIDPGKSIRTNTDNFKPAFFGLHFANDPNFKQATSTAVGRRSTRSAGNLLPQVNFQVHNDMVATAIRDIQIGEELFLDYQISSLK